MKFFITIFLSSTFIFGYSQTKKEKKAKFTAIHSSMYDGTESKKAEELYSAASKKQVNEDFKGAIKLYKQSLKEDPEFVESYDNMGLCYRRLGDFKNAIKYYEKSIGIYPKGTMAYQNLAVIYGVQKEYLKAINEYEKIQNLHPDNAEGYYGTINNYINLGKYEDAIKNAEKTVEIYEATESKYLYEGHYLLGMSYYYNKERDKAKTYLTLAKKGGFKVGQKLLDELDIK